MRYLQLHLHLAGALASVGDLVSWDDSCLPDLRWWSIVSHLMVGVPLDLCSSLFTDTSIRLMVSSLFAIFDQSPRASGGSLRGEFFFFFHLLEHQSVALFLDNTTALSYLRKEGSTSSSTLNIIAQSILRLCESHGVRLLPQFIPGHLNVLADSLSWGSQVLGSERTLCQDMCSKLLHRWPATIDLFATSLNHRLLVYFSPMVDPQSAGMNVMMQSWNNLQAYAFPRFGLMPWVLSKVRLSRSLEVTLVAPFWPLKPWFPGLLELLVEVPFLLPM